MDWKPPVTLPTLAEVDQEYFLDASILVDEPYHSILNHAGWCLDHSKTIKSFPPDFVDFQNEKLVILLSCHISSCADVLKQIANSQPKEFIIFTNLSQEAHVYQLEFNDNYIGKWGGNEEIPLDLDYFDTVQFRLSQIMQTDALMKIIHHPLCVSLLTEDLFLIPQVVDLFPQLNATTESNVDIQPNKGESELSAIISTLFDGLNIKDHLFVLGETSHRVAKGIIECSQESSRRTEGVETSVLLIDRKFDLVAPASMSENLLDLLYSYSPRKKPNTFDCIIPHKNVFDGNNELDDSDMDFLLAPRLSQDIINLFHAMLLLPQREALESLRKNIADFILRNLGSIDSQLTSGRTSLQQLHDMLSYLKNNEPLIFKNQELIVYYIALVNSANDMYTIRQELSNTEKVMVNSLVGTLDSSNVFHQLHDLLQKICKEKEAGFTGDMITTRDVLLLTLKMYSLMGHGIHIEHESELFLQKSFVRAMIASNSKVNVNAVSAWVSRVFGQLQKVRGCRSNLRKFQNVIDPQSIHGYHSLLHQICLEAIDSGEVNNQTDLIHVPYPSTITSVISGFQRFIKQSIPHPSSNSNFIVIVIGGITFYEVSLIQQLYRQLGIPILIGSTTITNRDNMMRQIFKSK